MNWYLATIVYQIVCGDGNHAAQFDEQIRLIAAPGANEALHKAIAIGCSEQDSFKSNSQQLVQWNFVNVPELYCVSENFDGAEVYSRINEVGSADAYITLVNDKAKRLHAKQAHLLNLI